MTDSTLDEDETPSCATCGDPIVATANRRVVTWIEGAEIRHRHFCDADCLEDWN